METGIINFCRAYSVPVFGLILTMIAASASFADVEAVSNVDQFQNFNFSVAGAAYAQAFTTGSDATVLTGVTIVASSDAGGTSQMNLREDNGGLPGPFIRDLGTLTIPDGDTTPTFAENLPVDLEPNTTYWLTMGEAGAGSGNFRWRGSTFTGENTSLSWSIADQVLVSSDGGITWNDVMIGGLPTESALFSAQIEPVQPPDNIRVTRRQTLPSIDFGPLSFGLDELPPELDVTFLLGPGTQMSGLIQYDIDDLLSAEVVIGDANYTVMDSFFMTITQFNGEISQLKATFAAIDTPTATESVITMNSPANITGTDIASGQDFSYTYAESTDTITAVPPPGNNVLVTRRQTLPVVESGPISFGLIELPAELNYTVMLQAKSSNGATAYNLDDVIFANIEIGDGVFTTLETFSAEIESDGTVESMNATFAAIDTPTVTDGVIVMNSPAFITGTDTASGLEFAYTYTESEDTVLTPTALGDVNLDCVVNLLDVAPFVQRISSGTYQLEADVNEDGAVNLLDVQPFVDLLNGG